MPRPKKERESNEEANEEAIEPESNESDDEDAIECVICSEAECSPANQIVLCDGQDCDVPVHQQCYGVTAVPPGDAKWFCERCKDGISVAKTDTMCCPSTKDPCTMAVKRTTVNLKYIHCVCAYWNEDIDVSLDKPVKVDKTVVMTGYPCDLCRKKKGIVVNCQYEGCQKRFHVTCAIQKDIIIPESFDIARDTHVFCDPHKKKYNREVTKGKDPVIQSRKRSVASSDDSPMDPTPKKLKATLSEDSGSTEDTESSLLSEEKASVEDAKPPKPVKKTDVSQLPFRKPSVDFTASQLPEPSEINKYGYINPNQAIKMSSADKPWMKTKPSPLLDNLPDKRVTDDSPTIMQRVSSKPSAGTPMTQKDVSNAWSYLNDKVASIKSVVGDLERMPERFRRALQNPPPKKTSEFDTLMEQNYEEHAILLETRNKEIQTLKQQLQEAQTQLSQMQQEASRSRGNGMTPSHHSDLDLGLETGNSQHYQTLLGHLEVIFGFLQLPNLPAHPSASEMPLFVSTLRQVIERVKKSSNASDS